MPIICWLCPKGHEFEKIEPHAPENFDDGSETRTCPKCGAAAKPTLGRPSPVQFKGRHWSA